MTRPTGEDEMSSEHVKALRELRDAGDVSDWRAMESARAAPKRRQYNPSGSLSEYGIFPECDAALGAQAQDAEIEALKSDLGDYMDAANYQAARAERLAEALRPLAELDLRPGGFDKRPDDQTIYARDHTVITVGDVRRAVAALRDHDQEGKDG